MLVRSDALEFLNSLAPGSVDLVCMDPPYYAITKEKWDRQWKDVDGYVEWLAKIFRACDRALAPSGSLFFFGGLGKHGEHPIFRVLAEAEKLFFFRDWITWRKRKAIGKDDRYLYCREEMLWLTKSPKGKRQKIVFNVPLTNELRGYDGFNKKYAAKSKYKRVTNVWDDIPELMRTRRPCEKPVPLMERIVLTHSNPGQLVVDPFAGTGATGVACKRRGRLFRGCDVDAEWVAKGNADIGSAVLLPEGTPIQTIHLEEKKKTAKKAQRSARLQRLRRARWPVQCADGQRTRALGAPSSLLRQRQRHRAIR